MAINDVTMPTINTELLIDDSETKTICIDVEYQLAVTVGSAAYEDTADAQYVVILGTHGQTGEQQCVGSFNAGTTVTCSVSSKVDIGEYRCVIWRTTGNDGWTITQVQQYT